MQELKDIDELYKILDKFVTSEWELIATPSKEWLEGADNSAQLIKAIEQADQECGSYGCEFDALYIPYLEVGLRMSVV